MTNTATPPIAQTKPWENLFGVCAALGEDFGFNPLWLRIAFGAGLIFQPIAVIVGYLALGVIVLISRKLAPSPRTKPAEAIVSALPARATDRSDDRDEETLPLAA